MPSSRSEGPRFVWEEPCCCENPARGTYHGRDGELHCEQCDGRLHACVSDGCEELVGGTADEFPYCARHLMASFRVLP